MGSPGTQKYLNFFEAFLRVGDLPNDTFYQDTEMELTAEYTCDSCGEEIQIALDPSAGSIQDYVEDCPVCCNPNELTVLFDHDGNAAVESRAEQDRY